MDVFIKEENVDQKPTAVFDVELEEPQFSVQAYEIGKGKVYDAEKEELFDSTDIKLEHQSEAEFEQFEYEIQEFQTESEYASDSDEDEDEVEDKDWENSSEYKPAKRKRQKKTKSPQDGDPKPNRFQRPKNSCIYCGQTVQGLPYQNEHYTDEHKELDDDKIVFVCPSCGEEFSTEATWQTHCSDIHKFDKLSGLSMVPAPSSASDRLGKVQCTTCNAVLSKKPELLLVHASIHLSHKMYKCRYCAAVFLRKWRIRTHFCAQFEETLKTKLPQIDYEEMSSSQRKRAFINMAYVCPVCGEEFDLKESWQQHLAVEHEIGDNLEKLNIVRVPAANEGTKDHWKCVVCDKTGTTRHLGIIKNHAFSHMPFKWRKCKKCNNTSAGILPCHCQQHGKSKYKLRLENIEGSTLLCTKCGASSENFTELNNHFRTAHNLSTPEDLNFKLLAQKNRKRYLTYECTKCVQPAATPFQAQSYSTMFMHAIKHDNADWLKCKYCDATYRYAFTMKNHAYMCQSGTESSRALKLLKQYVQTMCPACAKPHTVKSNFKKHINNDHGFNNISNLNIVEIKRRIENDDEDEETHYKCTICEHPFDSYLMKKLQHHAFLHMPHKLYNCKVCNLGFDTQVEIVQHLKHVHNIERSQRKPRKRRGKLLATKADIRSRPTKKSKRKKVPHKKKPTIKLPPRTESSETAATSADAEDPLHVASTTLAEISKIRTFCVNEGATMLEYGEYITYACPECNIPLTTQTDYLTHINLEHNFFDEDQLNTVPMPDSRKLQCTDCGVKVDPNVSHRQRHKLTHLPYQSYICALCGHRSNTAFVLVGHIRRRHFTVGAYKCPMCELILETPYKCVQHCRTQHTEAEHPPNLCTICFVTYKDLCSLRRHNEMHDFNRKLYTCHKCVPHRAYKTPVEYKRHLISQHQEMVPTEPVNCLICQQFFRNRVELAEHIKAQHADEQDNVDEFACKHCHRQFTRQTKLSAHMDALHSALPQQKPYPCDQCDRRFVEKKSLAYHWKRVHWQLELTMSKKAQEEQQEADQLFRDAKEIYCLICQQRFSDRFALAEHIKTQHSDEQVKLEPLVCKHCHQRFTRPSLLTTHMNAVRGAHSSQEPFPCDECELRFKRKKELIDHWKTSHFGMEITLKKREKENKFKNKVVHKSVKLTAKKRRLKKAGMASSASEDDDDESDVSDEFIAERKPKVVAKAVVKVGAKRVGRPRKKINYDESQIQAEEEYSGNVVSIKKSQNSVSNDDIIMECKPDVSTMLTTVKTEYASDFIAPNVKEEFLSDCNDE